MKFEQAFYTWGTEQMSFASKGLGICACSKNENSFIEKCMSIGSRFASEGIARTAEFCLYSTEFDSFVGVGLSPSADGGDGRANKLCHFYIPVESNAIAEPSEYILQYPFEKSVTVGTILEQREIASEYYSYKEILKKYSYDAKDEKNKKRLALLLWKTFSCVFGEERNLFFVIDRGFHPDKDKDSQMARELVWLLSMLVPQLKGKENRYRKQLSYGVYTVANTAAVKLIFTDRFDLGENRILLDMPVEEEDEVPLVFEALAESAGQSFEQYQEFLSELLSGGYQAELETSMFSKLYYRWKLNQGQKVSRNEIQDVLGSVMYSANLSSWHKKFLMDYLKQLEDLDMDDIIDYWEDVIKPWFGEYGQMKVEEQETLEDISFRFVCEMFQEDRRNYRVMIQNMPEEIRKKVLCRMKDIPQSCAEVEYREIDSVENLKKFVKSYRCFQNEEEFYEKILRKASKLYLTAKRDVRNEISNLMCDLNGEKWIVFLCDIYQEPKTCTSFVELIKEEFNKMEYVMMKFCYDLLWKFAKNAVDEEQDLVKECHALLNSSEKVRGEKAKLHESFEALFEHWEEQKMERFWDEARNYEDWIVRCIQEQLSQKNRKYNTKTHTIWEILKKEDYEELYEILEQNLEYQCILKENNFATLESKFQYRCFGVWVQVKQSELLNIKGMPYFGPINAENNLKQELKELVCSLEEQLLQKGNLCNREDIYNYFVLQEWKNESLIERNQYQYYEFRKIRDAIDNFREISSIHPLFAKSVLENEIIEGVQLIQDIWKKFRIYLQIVQYNKMELELEHLDEVSKLIREAKRVFGIAVEEVENLKEKREDFMDELKRQKIQLNEEIQYWEAKKLEAEQEIARRQERIERIEKSCRDDQEIECSRNKQMVGRTPNRVPNNVKNLPPWVADSVREFETREHKEKKYISRDLQKNINIDIDVSELIE